MGKNKKNRQQSGSPAKRAALTAPAPDAPTSFREALAAKTNLRTYHDISVRPAEDVEAAQRDVDVANQLVVGTLLHDDPKIRQRAKEAQQAAQAARDACFYRIWFASLGTAEFDALVDLHPPTSDTPEGMLWDPATFDPALLAACAQNADGTPCGLTAEEWAAELADPTRWAAPDVRRVTQLALAAQQQTMADAVPKG